jgi:hypothetical protein
MGFRPCRCPSGRDWGNVARLWGGLFAFGRLFPDCTARIGIVQPKPIARTLPLKDRGPKTSLMRDFNRARACRHQNDGTRLNGVCGVMLRLSFLLQKVGWCVLKRVDEPAPWSTVVWNSR